MLRSFTERIFGGVCGGLAAVTPFNVWLLRLAFMILGVASMGAFVALYLILWWVAPQETLTNRRQRGFGLFFVFGLVILMALLWLANVQGLLVTPSGVPLYLPIVAVFTAFVFFVRQVRA
jgi:phage shock protein PspC (stress-responsive transcriptional regulator)